MSNFGTPNPGTPGPMMPNPELPPRRRRSFAGPVVLILVGVVFLLGNMHLLSWSSLGIWFAHYWPLLLILWGVIKLAEHMQAQRTGQRAPGIGAGGVLLVVLIVISGLTATQAVRFREHWPNIRDQFNIDDEDFNNIFGDNYNFDDHLEQDFPAGASLKVIDTDGAVSVHASDDNKITVVVRKRVGADSQSDAEKYNSETKPKITVISDLVTLDANQTYGNHAVKTDLDISLPHKAAVSLVSRRGDVNVISREGNLDLNVQHGDVTVEEVSGNVKVSLEKGSAKIEQITGDVRVDGRLNETSVSDVKGTVQLEGEFDESVKLAHLGKSVTFKSSRTDMEFAKIEGDLSLDSDDLHADEITGPLHLLTRSKNIRLEDVSGDVRLQDDNGGVDVEMRSLGNVQIDNREGDIHVGIPEKSGFRLEARTRDGEIQSDFSDLKVDNGDDKGNASGSVGNATAHVVLNNEHGGIEIRKAAVRVGPKEGVSGGVTGGVPGAKQGKPAKTLPAPKDKVEPTEN
jgi:putative adhesin/cell wall-active antibiotic response 4TMS protein YvqF